MNLQEEEIVRVKQRQAAQPTQPMLQITNIRPKAREEVNSNRESEEEDFERASDPEEVKKLFVPQEKEKHPTQYRPNKKVDHNIYNPTPNLHPAFMSSGREISESGLYTEDFESESKDYSIKESIFSGSRQPTTEDRNPPTQNVTNFNRLKNEIVNREPNNTGRGPTDVPRSTGSRFSSVPKDEKLSHCFLCKEAFLPIHAAEHIKRCPKMVGGGGGGDRATRKDSSGTNVMKDSLAESIPEIFISTTQFGIL